MGRILGPRGMTAKQLEQETGCKIMVRGKGSMRDKKKVSYIFTLNIYFAPILKQIYKALNECQRTIVNQFQRYKKIYVN